MLAAQRLGVPFYNYCTVDRPDRLPNILRAWLPARHGGTTVLTITFENDVLPYPASAGVTGTTSSVQGLSRSAASRWLMDHSALFDVGTTLAPPHAVTASVATTAIEYNARRPWPRARVCDCPIHRIASVVSPKFVGIRPATARRRARRPPRPGQVDFIDYAAFVAPRAAGFDVLDPRAARPDALDHPARRPLMPPCTRRSRCSWRIASRRPPGGEQHTGEGVPTGRRNVSRSRWLEADQRERIVRRERLQGSCMYMLERG